MIWTSKSASTTEEGVIRVNYYVRDKSLKRSGGMGGDGENISLRSLISVN
jgi:hypothetical protein